MKREIQHVKVNSHVVVIRSHKTMSHQHHSTACQQLRQINSNHSWFDLHEIKITVKIFMQRHLFCSLTHYAHQLCTGIALFTGRNILFSLTAIIFQWHLLIYLTLNFYQCGFSFTTNCHNNASCSAFCGCNLACDSEHAVNDKVAIYHLR